MFAFVATDPNTMALKEAISAFNRDQFLTTMRKELTDHITQNHWKFIPISSVLSHKRYLPMVLSMKRKSNPVGKIVKWEAHLCTGDHCSVEFY